MNSGSRQHGSRQQSLLIPTPHVAAVLTFCAAVPAAWYHGPAAEKELAAATRVKGIDEPPHPSAYDAVAQPPEIHEYEEGGFRNAALSFPAPAAAAQANSLLRPCPLLCLSCLLANMLG